MLGKEITSGQFVSIEQSQRLKGFYVIGNTGSGKTTLLVNMILQDIEQGMGVCFFDTHGDAITDILKRLPVHREKDVILLDLLDTEYAFGLNLFQCSDPKNKQEVSRISSYVMQVFAKLFTDSGDLLKDAPQMAETLQNAIPVLLAHQNPHMTMAEIPLLLMDETARAKLLVPLNNLYVRNFWNSYNRWKPDRQEELTSSTRRRVGNFINDQLILEIIGQSDTTVDFRKIMDERKILLVKLSRQHELISSLVGSVIVGQIANAAFSREDTPEDQRIQFNLLADEYQRFSTPVFAELLAEVRKYKIATCVAHQWRGQLDYANRGATLNAANRVVYQVSGEDAKELAELFDTTPPPPTPEEKTRRAIQTPVSKPVDWLFSGKTHPNPKVNQFVANYITTKNFRKVPLGDGGFETPYYPLNYIPVGDLNELLYQVMRDKTPDMRLPPGLPSVDNMYMTDNCRNYVQMEPVRTKLSTSLNIHQAFYDLAPYFASYQELYDRELQSIIRDRERDREPFTGGNQWVNNDNYDPYRYRNNYKNYTDQMVQQAAHEKTQKILREIQQLKQFLIDLREVMYILAVEPIEEDSGRQEIVMGHGIQLSSAEMAARIANQLTNPAIPYTARAKIGTQEYTIQALPFRQPDDPDVVKARRERIIANTRKNYCKKRDEVEQEIAARQTELMKRDKKKPQATSDEDED